MTTPDLPTFLTQRYDEQEAWARACEGLHWQWVGNVTDKAAIPDPMLDEYLYGVDDENVSLRSVETFPYESIPGEGPRFLVNADEVRTVAAGHIATHDPAYVLTDLAAKRRIVELHTRYEPNAHECPGDFSTFAVAEGIPCPTLRALASAFADHPDFRPEWKL